MAADKLAGVKAVTWSTKGKIIVAGADNPFTSRVVYHGHERRRVEFEADFGGQTIKAIVVVNGDKGSRQFNGMTEELTGDELARERRTAYLEWTTATIDALKQPPFKTEPAGDQRVNDRPAVGVKITGPDGKTHTLYFDKETHLPAKLVATVVDFGGEATHETTFSDYHDFGGVKKAKKVSVKRDGQDFIEAEVTEFKAIDAPDAATFEKPE